MNGLFINVFETNSQIYEIFDEKTAKFSGIFYSFEIRYKISKK
jgi:hypothetical protein